jgi:hypothetical protein
LTLLDGEGEPSKRIATAATQIAYAGESILGELYGWVYAERAPKYNGCATDIVRLYLGATSF